MEEIIFRRPALEDQELIRSILTRHQVEAVRGHL